MPKPILPITLQMIRRAKPGDEVRDGAFPGLSLRVYASGAAWTLTTRTPSGRARIPLGQYPALSVPGARVQAAQAREGLKGRGGRLVDRGARETLASVLGLYSHTASLNGSWYDAEKRIRHVFRALLNTPAEDLTLTSLQRAADAHASVSSAAAAVRYVRPLIKWGRKRGHFQATMDERDLEQPRTIAPRERVLTDDELKKLLARLTYEGYDGAVRFMLATGARREEVCGATWGELDLAVGEKGVEGVWTIPGARRKNRRALSIPLSSYALGVLERVPGRECDGRPCGVREGNAVMFRGPKGAGLSNWDRWQKQCFKRTGTSKWHRHDLRRTVATIAGTSGADPHIVEVLLGHADPHTPLASTYNKSRYVPEHLQALETVGAYLWRLETTQ